jgi:hypothetical protein
MNKLLSGRFILTIIAGVAFLYCTVTGKIEEAAVTAILSMIFQSYFNRTDRGDHK